MSYHAAKSSLEMNIKQRMIIAIISSWKYLVKWGKERLKVWTKPASLTIAVGTLAVITGSRSDLIAENALLRQQLMVLLNRQVKRPQLTNGDCLRMVMLARCTWFWKQAIHKDYGEIPRMR